jgi:single-strand DNA-binding protein
MNSISIVGRLGKTPDLKYTTTGKAVTNFSVAVYKDKEHTDWFDCVAFERTAELITQFCQKGDFVGVTGSIHQREYLNQTTQEKVRLWEISARNITLVNSTRAESPKPTAPKPTSTPDTSMAEDMALGAMLADDMPW